MGSSGYNSSVHGRNNYPTTLTLPVFVEYESRYFLQSLSLFPDIKFSLLTATAEWSLMNELCLWCLLASSKTCYQNFNNMGSSSSMLVCVLVLCNSSQLQIVQTVISLSKATQEENFKISHAPETKLKQKKPHNTKCSRFVCMSKITES